MDTKQNISWLIKLRLLQLRLAEVPLRSHLIVDTSNSEKTLTGHHVNSSPDDDFRLFSSQIINYVVSGGPDLAGTNYLQSNDVYTEPEDPRAALSLSGRSSRKGYTIIFASCVPVQISCGALTEGGDQIHSGPEAPHCERYHRLLICYCQQRLINKETKAAVLWLWYRCTHIRTRMCCPAATKWPRAD